MNYWQDSFSKHTRKVLIMVIVKEKSRIWGIDGLLKIPYFDLRGGGWWPRLGITIKTPFLPAFTNYPPIELKRQ